MKIGIFLFKRKGSVAMKYKYGERRRASEYEKALVEFLLVENYGPTEEYLETETIVKLKGTDEYIVIKED